MLSDDSIFSFEIDTLEIVLKEQVDVVDKFFLGRQLSNNQVIKMFDNLFFSSKFPDPAVEANFTHKGVRFKFFILSLLFSHNTFQRNKPMMWQSVKDTERFDFVPKTKVIYIPLGQFS